VRADSFDRLRIARALVEGLLLVTGDSAIQRHGVPILEA